MEADSTASDSDNSNTSLHFQTSGRFSWYLNQLGVSGYNQSQMTWKDHNGNEFLRFNYIDSDNHRLDVKRGGAWSQIEGSLVGPTSKNNDTVYQAEGDGILKWATAYNTTCTGYTDSNNPPTTVMMSAYNNTVAMPVKRGDYYKVTNDTSSTMRWWYFA
jgi:hypothetical protein